MENGVMAGYPVVDVKATLYDGSYHDVDSSEMAFKIAGSMAFKEGAEQGNPVLLEPIMKVEVVTPEDYMGDVMGDLNRRRGIVQGMEDTRPARWSRPRCRWPRCSAMRRTCVQATQGRATYSMEFEKYAEVPQNVADELSARNR